MLGLCFLVSYSRPSTFLLGAVLVHVCQFGIEVVHVPDLVLG